MNRYLLTLIVIFLSLSVSAQTQSWQWIKAGGSNSDNFNGAAYISAECRIGGCDARGNIYAAGIVNGPNMRFDTFSSPGAFSVNNVGVSYLLFSYDCSGHMRWAKQIGDDEGNGLTYGIVTDPQGNTYLAGQFWYGMNGGTVTLYLGDSVLTPSNVLTQPYLCVIKYDSLGKLVWFKNLEEDTAYTSHTAKSNAYGLRIGTSGNLWMATITDSNYAISPNLHTTKKGKYNIEIDPNTGNILGGYYISNKSYGDYYHPDASYDLDQNENYYETGQLFPTISNQTNGDTLILANKVAAVDTNYFPFADVPFIFSLDKRGNFRYLIMQDTVLENPFFELGACKFDMLNNQLITTCAMGDSGVHMQGASFGYHPDPNNPTTQGIYCIGSNGNLNWCKYITSAYGGGNIFANPITSQYISGTPNNGYGIYDNTDTITTGIGSCISNCGDYYRKITRINGNGNYVASYTAHLGYINTNGVDGDHNPSAFIDWRGNVYMGGSITSYMSTPADSVHNTDGASGNFFIAKLGISNCSCTSPGAQFTQTSHGDTVYFYGGSLNYNDSIRWRLGDGTFISTDTFAHLYAHDGTYTVTEVAYSPCGIDSMTKQITVTGVGIVVVEPNKTLLYPNPVTGNINIDVSGNAIIGLIAANGTMLWDAPKQVNQSGTYVFDMSNYASGVYYYVVQYTNGQTDVVSVVRK